jgi:hypothetical protein
VPASAFTPVSILDPGPDGVPGTFDDQRLTVYAQNPATLGQDRYLFTNPAGLRMLNTGLLAEASTNWRRLMFHASFVAEKSYGPTNPGDTVYENDPGVIGTCFSTPTPPSIQRVEVLLTGPTWGKFMPITACLQP